MHPAASEETDGAPIDARRWLQLALAAIWVIDGLLQFQTFMFTKAFSTQVLAPTAEGNPRWIGESITWSASVVAANPVIANLLFAILQLTLGLGIASRRAVKPALVASIVWSLLVWWFGEGLGGILTGGASPLGGAPGAVLLYAVLAVLLWPTPASTAQTFVAAKPIGAAPARAVWIVLWGGLAALGLQPANLTPGGVHDTVDGMGSGQPAWLNGLVESFTRLSAHNGVVLSVVGTVVLALIAVGVLLPRRFGVPVVVAAVAASLFIWVIGEALGGLIGGQSTDVNSGPLLVLFALAYWPGRASSHSDAGLPTAVVAS